jgi:hypothetical protein
MLRSVLIKLSRLLQKLFKKHFIWCLTAAIAILNTFANAFLFIFRMNKTNWTCHAFSLFVYSLIYSTFRNHTSRIVWGSSFIRTTWHALPVLCNYRICTTCWKHAFFLICWGSLIVWASFARIAFCDNLITFAFDDTNGIRVFSIFSVLRVLDVFHV